MWLNEFLFLMLYLYNIQVNATEEPSKDLPIYNLFIQLLLSEKCCEDKIHESEAEVNKFLYNKITL